MILNILKKDLKRKKIMNTILFIFTILAAMFVSSGLSIVNKVVNGTDYFLDKAGAGDYIVLSQNRGVHINKTLNSSKAIKSYKTDELYFSDKSNLDIDGKKIKLDNNIIMYQSVCGEGLKFFLDDDSQLNKVNKGDIYIAKGFLADNDLKVGDKIGIKFGKVDKKFRIAGEFKDAVFGSDLLSNKRFIFNEEDYNEFEKDKSLESQKGWISYIMSDDVSSLAKEISKADNIMFSAERSIVKLSYVMEMVIALIVLVLSVCLIIVSFIILKFVITFTIGQEYKQIGVMKAIGLKNRKVRKIYIIKYFFISFVGGIVGFIASFPLEKIILKSATEKMMLGSESGIFFNILGGVVVIVLMVLFAYYCTRKVNKLSPVDAIRNGQTGERYKKKTFLKIKNTHMKNTLYLAFNDIISAPKQFVTVIITFFLCSVLVLGIVVCTDTLKSDCMIETLSKKSDIYISDSKMMKMSLISENGEEQVNKIYDDIEKKLEKEDMPAKVGLDALYNYKVSYEDKEYTISCYQNKKSKASEFTYYEGSAPQNDSEIGITPVIAKKFGVGIGDTLTIDFINQKKECMIVGMFQSMLQVGEVIRLHEDAQTNMKYASGLTAFVVDYEDNPDKKEIERRKEKIKEIFDIEQVYNAAEFCAECTKVAGTMDKLSKSFLLVVIIVVMLVTVLMEKVFVTDEKSQIALLKAIGFKNKSIIKWHVNRFLIVVLITEILAVIFAKPVTRLWCDRIWASMGATSVDYVINPLTVMVIYPGIVLITNILTAFLTSLSIRKIKSNDISNIE